MHDHDHASAGIEALLLDPDSQIRASQNELVADEGPWAGGPEAVEGHLREVVADLNRIPELVVEHAEFRHYGSGYASNVDVFLTKRDGSTRRVEPDGYITVEGITVVLCRLAPIACVLSPGERSHHPDGRGAWSLPWLSDVREMPIPGWERGSEQISHVLDRHRIALIGPDLLSRRALPGLKIDTNLGDGPPHSIFDVWFHWAD
ncbi:hypothetical protein GCM10023194_40630 [Planotetraspora phitsanulokensis]|uniref:Uncharacterized protein n=1 Tax=Planotetraspora phitsanulokensis TaxID=575192 RepID=A0A8J3UEM1_9ACTN|nr:hypothetical protein [Planotetraspora phitsanulokensis]GII40949.1 hypothetical protein Pph01_59520 [Planotetraspora phitsanulokensis]